MTYGSSFFTDRPKNEDERDAMVSFFKLEQECDEANQNMFEHMNTEHLTKTKIKGFLARTKANATLTKRNIKKALAATCFSSNKPRTWLHAT